MFLKPLEQFICDGCGEIIDDPKFGWVEWLREKDSLQVHGFRIVHHQAYSPLKETDRYGCSRYPGKAGCSDDYLERFLGSLGIVQLLRFIDLGPYHDPDYSVCGGPQVKNLREWTELFRRLHIPYYEEARLYWDEALEDLFFDGANEILIYKPDFLKELIERYGEK